MTQPDAFTLASPAPSTPSAAGDLARPFTPRLAVSQAEELGEGALKAFRRSMKSASTRIIQVGGDTKITALVRKSIKAYERRKYRDAITFGLEAIGLDPAFGPAYQCVALGLEKLGELHKAIQFFEKAVELDPADAQLYYNLGNTAWRLEMQEGAVRLFRFYIDMAPEDPRGHNNLASVLRDMGRYEDALETARAALYTCPEDPFLWNTVGTILTERGDVDDSATFFQEALRLDPKFGLARHNMACAAYMIGDYQGALDLWRQAARDLVHDEVRQCEIGHGVAHCLLGIGRLEEGWAKWEIRHNPNFRQVSLFALPGERWTGEDPAGKRILIIGEQGIGDEIKFATALPDLIDRVGPDGKVLIAVTDRLVPLFQRAMPEAVVGPLATTRHNGKILRVAPWAQDWIAQHGPIDLNAPMGDTLRWLRRDIEDFTPARPFLKADPDRVTHWRGRLNALGPGPHVGLCWRSGLMTAVRTKFYCPLTKWGPVLQVPNIRWINLQYDDYAADREQMARSHGVQITHFDDLDLRNDLDDNAALCAALDLVISAPTAAAALAAAIGTPTWVVANTILWTNLGTDRLPWYPDTRLFVPSRFARWEEAMDAMGGALQDFQGARAAA